MSFRRYIAPTVRDAMERVRRELGQDAVILSNKRLGPGRVEIVAAASDSMQALVETADRPRASAREPAREPARSREREEPGEPAESFQDFIRRQSAPAAPRAREAATIPSGARARATPRSEPVSVRAGVAMYQQVAQARVQADAPAATATARPIAAVIDAAPPPAVFRRREPGDGVTTGAAQPARVHHVAPVASAPAPAPQAVAIEAAPATAAAPAAPPEPPPQMSMAVPSAPAPSPRPAAVALPTPPSAHGATSVDAQVMSELRSLRTALSDRIAALEENIASMSPNPVAPAGQRTSAMTRVMTRLLMSGFSPDLARRIAAHAPATSDIAATDTWLHQVVTTNLRCASAVEGLMEAQGAVALVGPTGVGKTTTVAKLAARFAVRHGAAQLGLVTLDSYRMGAHEQLRSYSRILGVPMHIAQDGPTLCELLASLHGKRLVLIDTCGLSQRDERMREMLAILGSARFNGQPVKPVVLLNAASHSETLDEVARAWHAQDAAGAILTKLDEAARIGGAVDCLLRYRLMLFGLTNGQRVPEDWHPAGASLVAHVALKPSSSPFALADEEAQAWTEQPQGNVHA